MALSCGIRSAMFLRIVDSCANEQKHSAVMSAVKKTLFRLGIGNFKKREIKNFELMAMTHGAFSNP